MGKIFKIKQATTFLEIIIIVVGLGLIGLALNQWAPGLTTEESKQLDALAIDEQTLDNVMTANMVELPSKTPSLSVINKPLVRIAGYAWNGQAGMYGANGGARTTKGSLMEDYGINLEISREDWLSELSNRQLNFIKEYNEGNKYPTGEKTAFAIMIMGDGAPYYISTRQKAIDEKFGEGKYHLQVIGAIGMSDGEDKLIGPPEWKTNPKSMLGKLISTVPGDGDWVTTLNYCFANGLKVNPNFNTFDYEAVNFYPSADDDYINSAKELIASQLEGFTVELKVVKDGQLTGETINKPIDGCATWTPGDKMVFDALVGFTDVASTADFPNQMATTLIAVKEWAEENPETVSNILKGALTVSNQMKQYDQWRWRAAEAVADGFGLEDANYWYTMHQGQTGSKNGISYNMGGTRALNYADAMQYYGLTDGINRYRAVYNQVSNYLTELNPFDFNDAVDRVVPYEEAVNLTFLKNITDIEEGVVTKKADYSAPKTEVLATGEWNINFATGSANVLPTSYHDLDNIYNLLVQAEQTKVSVVGHTDNTGSDSVNLPLSKSRAESVVEYLLNKGIPINRIQIVDGKGSTDPVASNGTAIGRAKNRRVEVTFLQ